MSMKVTYDLSPMEKKFGPGNVRKCRQLVANQILLDSEHYVPKDDGGHLRASGSVGLDGSAVYWNTVYARAQFYGDNGIVTFRKYTTPGTGKKWSEKASKDNMKNWEEVAKKGLGIR